MRIYPYSCKVQVLFVGNGDKYGIFQSVVIHGYKVGNRFGLFSDFSDHHLHDLGINLRNPFGGQAEQRNCFLFFLWYFRTSLFWYCRSPLFGVSANVNVGHSIVKTMIESINLFMFFIVVYFFFTR